ncbi:MAG TPA: hypothetical protein PL045_05315 [Chitinophagaceae bacterium]|nr:hypothetical protein [Chitinophagaceae bacterium]
MSVDVKHIATFLLGAAAGAAAFKYMSMTDEEKEQLAAKLKSKAADMKTEAEKMMNKGKEYFDELKTKGGDALKDHFPDAESFLHNLFGGKTEKPQDGAGAAS